MYKYLNEHFITISRAGSEYRVSNPKYISEWLLKNFIRPYEIGIVHGTYRTKVAIDWNTPARVRTLMGQAISTDVFRLLTREDKDIIQQAVSIYCGLYTGLQYRTMLFLNTVNELMR